MQHRGRHRHPPGEIAEVLFVERGLESDGVLRRGRSHGDRVLMVAGQGLHLHAGRGEELAHMRAVFDDV